MARPGMKLENNKKAVVSQHVVWFIKTSQGIFTQKDMYLCTLLIYLNISGYFRYSSFLE